jgi:hypothetical protein
MSHKRLADKTNLNRLASDEGNTSFAPQSPNLAHAKVGFDAGEGRREVSKGHHRFPRRKSKDEIPEKSLAERLRANH